MLTVVAARVVGVDRAGIAVVRRPGEGVLVETRLRRDAVGVLQLVCVADEELAVALVFRGGLQSSSGRGRGGGGSKFVR